MKREPLFTAAGISAFAAALVTLFVAFGVDLDEEQITAVLGFVAWVLIEAVDLSWLPGGRDGIRLTDEALHLGDTTFKIDELTGEVTWEPGHPEQLELGLTRGGTLPVETERPDELRNALRRALPA